MNLGYFPQSVSEVISSESKNFFVFRKFGELKNGVHGSHDNEKNTLSVAPVEQHGGFCR